MMNIYRGLLVAASILTALASSPASANSVTEPGFTTGVPVYAKFPEGLYLIMIPEIGRRDTNPDTVVKAVTPFFFYQSPLELAKARISFVLAPIYLDVNVKGVFKAHGLYNTYGGVQATWDLGNNWGAGVRLSGYAKQTGAVAKRFWTVEPRAGITYFDGKTNFTVNLETGFPQQSESNRTAPNYFNYDLTYTRKVKKLELGVIGFGSTDTSRPIQQYRKQSQFAVGPLIGYDFGRFSAQLKLSSDVYQRNYGGAERRAQVNFTIPLWVRAAPPPTSVPVKP